MKKQTEKPFVESFAEKAGILKHRKDEHPRLIYLSGAVTNDPHAKLEFDLAEMYLKARGNAVINPLRVNPPGVEWGDAMAADLSILNRMKDYYKAVAWLAHVLPENRVYWPTVCDIDPTDRQFESPGKRLELSFASDVIPVIRLSADWDNLLKQAIEESEAQNGNG